MKSIMMTYPNFQALPRGLRIMLLESESFFFGEANSQAWQEIGKWMMAMKPGGPGWLPYRHPLQMFDSAWKN